MVLVSLKEVWCRQGLIPSLPYSIVDLVGECGTSV